MSLFMRKANLLVAFLAARIINHMREEIQTLLQLADI